MNRLTMDASVDEVRVAFDLIRTETMVSQHTAFPRSFMPRGWVCPHGWRVSAFSAGGPGTRRRTASPIRIGCPPPRVFARIPVRSACLVPGRRTCMARIAYGLPECPPCISPGSGWRCMMKRPAERRIRHMCRRPRGSSWCESRRRPHNGRVVRVSRLVQLSLPVSWRPSAGMCMRLHASAEGTPLGSVACQGVETRNERDWMCSQDGRCAAVWTDAWAGAEPLYGRIIGK
jgi:hypothetical protein